MGTTPSKPLAKSKGKKNEAQAEENEAFQNISTEVSLYYNKNEAVRMKYHFLMSQDGQHATFITQNYHLKRISTQTGQIIFDQQIEDPATLDKPFKPKRDYNFIHSIALSACGDFVLLEYRLKFKGMAIFNCRTKQFSEIKLDLDQLKKVLKLKSGDSILLENWIVNINFTKKLYFYVRSEKFPEIESTLDNQGKVKYFIVEFQLNSDSNQGKFSKVVLFGKDQGHFHNKWDHI